MELDEAFDLISRAIDTGHAAHGYLLVGDVRGNCSELIRRILLKLFQNFCIYAVDFHGKSSLCC